MDPLDLPTMTPKQEASWRGIIAVSRRVRDGWCLVGGQMVQLWCWERGSQPNRPTDDGDAVLDIRALVPSSLSIRSAVHAAATATALEGQALMSCCAR